MNQKKQENSSKEVALILKDHYLGIGATALGALSSLSEDLSRELIKPSDFACTNKELMIAIGMLIDEIIKLLTEEIKDDVAQELAKHIKSVFANKS